MKIAALTVLLSATLLLSACASHEKPAPAMGMMNTTCPFSGEALNAKSPTAEYQGKKIGFCCNKCLAKFNKMDDAGKAAEAAKAK